VFATGSEPLMASISWYDRAALANNGTNDPDTILLTNDLDLRIIGNGETYFPWTLDPSIPSAAAVRSADNFRDNFEKVEIDNPVAGTYIVQVSHKGSLVSGNQFYSLIVSGINQTLSTNSLVADEFRIYPNPARGSFNISSPSYSGDLQLQLFDVQGRRVMERKITGTQNEINVNGIPTGVYMVRLSSDSGVITKKLVIQ
ncbi:MAG: T9SS type A sorting domain-containing protein, partial [Flavobacterium sp.]